MMEEEFMTMRETCFTCKRSKVVCLCDFIKPLSTNNRYVILTHPREAKCKTSTGWLAHLNLVGSKYIVDFNMDKNQELADLLGAPTTNPLLLFPGPNAQTISQVREAQPNSQPYTVLVIEGTWTQARHMIARTPALQALPAVTLNIPGTSQFRIRKQPAKECFSTIEAISSCLQEFDEMTEERSETFLQPFHAMVQRQIDFQIERHPDHRRQWEV
jgi:DTW domain-containing protein YfiP